MLDSHQLGLVVVVVTVVEIVVVFVVEIVFVVAAVVVSGLGFSNRKFLQVGKSSGKYESGRFSISSSTCNRSIIPSQLLQGFKYFLNFDPQILTYSIC